MTIEHVDEVTEAQDALDGQQDATQTIAAPPAPALTAADIERIVSAQLQPVVAQVRGLQSGWDRGLNAIRQDTVKSVTQQVAELARQRREDDFVASLPEDYRQAARQHLDSQRPQQQAPAPSAAPEPPAPAQADPSAEALKVVMSQVSAMGADPSDRRLNYTAMLNGDQNTFLKSLSDVIKNPTPAQNGTAPRAAAAPAAGRAAQTSTPPVTRAPASGGGISTQDALYDAIIAGRVSGQQAQEIANQRGWSL